MSGDLTKFIVNLHRTRKARRGSAVAKPFMGIGTVFGLLTVVNMGRTDGGSVMKYDCKCQCGNTVSLNSKEVKDRAENNQGCLSPMCKVSEADIDRVITDRDTCLKDQFRRLTIYKSDQMCEEWGGKGSEIDLGSAYENFYEYMIELGASEDNGYWMPYKIRSNGLYEPGNVELGTHDRTAGTAGERLFIYEHNLLSISEAAGILGCEIEEITTLQDAMISDEDIFDSFN